MTRLNGARLRSIGDTFRRRGVARTITQALHRRGIDLLRYWWIRERLPAAISDDLVTLPEGLTFRILSEADLPELLTFPARGAPMEERHLTDGFARGDTCLGVVRGEEIVGFGWCSLDATHSNVHPATMAPNEAYLHNMYVLPELRGYRLAPIIRYRTYQLLADTGRDTYYSITVVSNEASWRFKEKLGAEKLLHGVYLGVRERWHWRVTLRRYK